MLTAHASSLRAIKYGLFYMDMSDIESRVSVPRTLIAVSGEVSWGDPNPMSKRLRFPLAG